MTNATFPLAGNTQVNTQAIPQPVVRDLFSLGARTTYSNAEVEEPLEYQVTRLGYVLSDDRIVSRLGRGDIVKGVVAKWYFVYNGSPGGLEKTNGSLGGNYDRLSSADGIDTRFLDHAILAIKTDTAATPDPTGNLSGLHSLQIFDTLIMGIGGGANVSLIKPTSSTDPTPAAITYTPGAVISCLAEAIIGGVTNARRMIVGRTASAPQVLSDASGTVAGTMHTDLVNLWAAQQMYITDRPILFAAGNNLYSLTAASAIGDAPTLVATGVLPKGGANLGILGRGGGPQRWYLHVPKEEAATGLLLFGGEKTGRIVHFNQAGTDMQEMQPSDFLGITDIYAAKVWEDGVAVTDRKRIVVNRGEEIEDVGYARDRAPDSDREWVVRDYWPKGPELIIWEQSTASPNGTGNTIDRIISYDSRTKAYNVVSKQITTGTTGRLGVLFAGVAPVSPWNVYYRYVNGNWYYKFDPPYGHNPFTEFRQTAGSQSTTGVVYEASGNLITTRFRMGRSLSGWRKVVSAITFEADNTGGGDVTATRKYTFGGVDATFTDIASTGTDAYRTQIKEFADNDNFFDQSQFRVDLTQGTSTYMTPNAAGVKVEGYAFYGIAPRPPKYIDDNDMGLPAGVW